MNLLDEARKALPGLEWTDHGGIIAASISNRCVASMQVVRGEPQAQITEFTAWSGYDEYPLDVASWLRAQVVARRDALNAALGEQPAGQWALVGERLPTSGRNVPLWTDRGLMFGSRGLVESETWLWADQYGDAEAFADVTVTHWLDLQPPKETP